jgi:GGDEF domain-containing protein
MAAECEGVVIARVLRSVDVLVTAWPAPAAIGGVIALAVSFAGDGAQGLQVALAGAAASLLLARIELSRTRDELEDLRAQLDNALTQDGFLDIDTGLGTLAMLRVDWARQLARYQRRGERFSIALIDVREAGVAGDAGPDVIAAAAERLSALTRTEDTVYRIAPGRLAVLLAGSDSEGASAFIERALPMLETLQIDGFGEPVAVNVQGEAVDWREGAGSFPEHRLLWNAEAAETAARLLDGWVEREAGPGTADAA